MSVVVNAARRRLEVARRGWNAVILAHEGDVEPSVRERRSRPATDRRHVLIVAALMRRR